MKTLQHEILVTLIAILGLLLFAGIGTANAATQYDKTAYETTSTTVGLEKTKLYQYKEYRFAVEEDTTGNQKSIVFWTEVPADQPAYGGRYTIPENFEVAFLEVINFEKNGCIWAWNTSRSSLLLIQLETVQQELFPEILDFYYDRKHDWLFVKSLTINEKLNMKDNLFSKYLNEFFHSLSSTYGLSESDAHSCMEAQEYWFHYWDKVFNVYKFNLYTKLLPYKFPELIAK